MIDLTLPTHRRGFLGQAAGGAAALGLAGLATPLNLAAAPQQAQGKEDPAGQSEEQHQQRSDHGLAGPLGVRGRGRILSPMNAIHRSRTRVIT